MSEAGARSRNPERSLRRISESEVYSAFMERADLREYATDAIKFWEPWRLLYNLTLAAIVIIYFGIGYPLSKAALTVDFCLGLFLLAVIANVAYCAAYIVDIFAQASGFREIWRRSRKVLFIIGRCLPPSLLDLSPWACSRATDKTHSKRKRPTMFP